MVWAAKGQNKGKRPSRNWVCYTCSFADNKPQWKWCNECNTYWETRAPAQERAHSAPPVNRWTQGPPSSLGVGTAMPPKVPPVSGAAVETGTKHPTPTAPRKDGAPPTGPADGNNAELTKAKLDLANVCGCIQLMSAQIGMEDVVEQMILRKTGLTNYIAQVSPKPPNTVLAQRLLQKIQHKSQVLRNVKKDIIDTAKKLKELKEDYATRRKALVQLRDQWDQIDTTLGDPPSEAPEEWSSTENAQEARPPVEVLSDPEGDSDMGTPVRPERFRVYGQSTQGTPPRPVRAGGFSSGLGMNRDSPYSRDMFPPTKGQRIMTAAAKARATSPRGGTATAFGAALIAAASACSGSQTP